MVIKAYYAQIMPIMIA